MLDATRLWVYGKLQCPHHSKALPGQLLDLSQEHRPVTTCRALGKVVLVVLLLSCVLVLFCWVHRAELPEKLPLGHLLLPLGHWLLLLGHLLLSGSDILFTVMDGLCTLAAVLWFSGHSIGI